MKGSSSAFRTYILKNPDINDKFRKHNSKSTRTVRFETEYGKQAQVDWKESFQVILKDLSKVEINIFTYLLSNSRYRVNILSLSKSRKVLFDFLDKSFMDESRTKNSEGKINNEFNQFAKDYGFKPNICMAKRR